MKKIFLFLSFFIVLFSFCSCKQKETFSASADETNKTYSKSIFTKENDLDKLDIEKTIESLERNDDDE